MGNIDLNADGALIAEYELSVEDFLRLNSRVRSMVRGQHRDPRHVSSFLFWGCVGFGLFASFNLAGWAIPILPDFGMGMLAGIALAAAALLWIAIWQRIQGRKIYAQLLGPQPIQVRLHESGISWSNPNSRHFFMFEAFDEVSSFDGGLLLKVRSGAVFIPGKFIHQAVEGGPVMEILRARLPGLNWHRALSS